MILPTIVLGWSSSGTIARLTRSSLLEVMRNDYIRTARAKGMREFAVITRHAFKNAIIPVVTVMAIQLASLLSGAVITETIFSIPGIGRLSVNAIENRDAPLLQGTVIFTAALIIAGNLIADRLYSVIDPRIRWTSSSTTQNLRPVIGSSLRGLPRRAERRAFIPSKEVRLMFKRNPFRNLSPADQFSQEAAEAILAGEGPSQGTGLLDSLKDMLRANKAALAGLIIIVIVALMAVLAPLIAPYDPYLVSLKERTTRPPRPTFWAPMRSAATCSPA
jgi:ABC-type dipeptide/oligopeptide/nickel transport system permease subunit